MRQGVWLGFLFVVFIATDLTLFTVTYSDYEKYLAGRHFDV